jgi:hypothetical protein
VLEGLICCWSSIRVCLNQRLDEILGFVRNLLPVFGMTLSPLLVLHVVIPNEHSQLESRRCAFIDESLGF